MDILTAVVALVLGVINTVLLCRMLRPDAPAPKSPLEPLCAILMGVIIFLLVLRSFR